MWTYTGKWGKFHRQCVVDGRLREVVEECAALPGYEVFKYYGQEGQIKDVKSRELNAYVKEVIGEEFTAKDFRTWTGTLVVAAKLAELGATEDLKAAEKNIVAAIDAVTERLGNTRAIARSSYVSPRVIDHYKEGSVISYYSERIEEVIVGEQGDLTQGEKALLEYSRGSSGASWRRQLEGKGGSPLNAKTVLRLLSNPKIRRVVIRLLKSPTVRQIIISQVKRRMRHR